MLELTCSTHLAMLQKCCPSNNTATQSGSNKVNNSWATWTVILSWSCNLREKISIARAILLNHIILSFGIYQTCANQKKGNKWCSQVEKKLIFQEKTMSS